MGKKAKKCKNEYYISRLKRELEKNLRRKVNKKKRITAHLFETFSMFQQMKFYLKHKI